jgi:spermidine synthase
VGRPDILFVGEGMNASVAVSVSRQRCIRNFHVSGKIEASNWPQDMRLQRMLGDLRAVMHPHPQSVLVVGCGAGVTAGSFTVFPEIEKITICELEPLVPEVAARYFSAENYNVLKDPRTRTVRDDGRHYLLTTRSQFDIITSDPIHPWVKGSAELYTQEYFELVKKHLRPGGLAT